MMRIRFRPALPLLALVLAACGHPPDTAPRPLSAAGAVTSSPHPVAMPQAPAAPADPATQQRVTSALARLDAVKTMVGDVSFDETKAPPGNFEHGEAKFTFRHHPFAARVDVLSSNRWFANGATILWTGGTTLEVKAAHVFFALPFAYDDPQVTSARGYRMDQTDIFSMGKVLRAPGARISPVGPATIKGEGVFLLEVHSPASLPGITREIIGIHDRLNIPTYREMYAGDQLVHRGQGKGLVLDGAIADEQFHL